MPYTLLRSAHLAREFLLLVHLEWNREVIDQTSCP